MNWNDIRFPPNIAALPRNEKGIPIPYFAAKIDGKRDLRFSDPKKQEACANKKVCWVCGKPLDFFAYFVGGEKSAASLFFSDGPMHKECAEFSLTYCPFLATPQLGYSGRNVPANVAHPTHAVTERSPRQSLTCARRWKAMRMKNRQGEIYFKVTELETQQFWKNGMPEYRPLFQAPEEPKFYEVDYKEIEEKVAAHYVALGTPIPTGEGGKVFNVKDSSGETKK